MTTETKNEWKVENLPVPGLPEVKELPPIVSAEQFLEQILELPTELVSGMIHRGTLSMFAGGSKSFKTFTLLDLAISVSQGVPWWGRDVIAGRVLYVNFEISPPFFQNRLLELSAAKELTPPLVDFDVWNLRGCAADVEVLMPTIISRCVGQDYAMIVMDPIYKLLGGKNENAAGDMALFLNAFETLATETGAAVIYSHHFAKGLASGKEQLDRASGSGVFARHADAIITITPHEEESAFVVEATLRNMPAPKPFVMRWGYPLMTLAPELDAKKLKNKVGAKAKYNVTDVVSSLVDGMTTSEWKAVATLQLGFVASTFSKLKKEAVDSGRVEARGKRWFSNPRIHKLDMATGVTTVRDPAPHERRPIAA